VHPKCGRTISRRPPLVVAYALAGRIDIEFDKEPIGTGKDGRPVYLKDLCRRSRKFATPSKAVKAEAFRRIYADVFTGDAHWQNAGA